MVVFLSDKRQELFNQLKETELIILAINEKLLQKFALKKWLESLIELKNLADLTDE
ncbi:MAG: hypothetical protein GF311_17200 [Candidatus Lokiarchaeota archaeon]|nr:hypothetical protein [Candidatus Lokiarchaeota archaeon]